MTPQEQTIKLHQEWLRHPVTQDAVRILESRVEYYKKALQDRILVESNEKSEQSYRDSMKTANVLINIITNTTTFVEQLNKIKPQ